MQERHYVIEGRKCIEEALKSNLPLKQIIGTDAFGSMLAERNLLGSTPFEVVTQRTLESMSSLQSNNTGLAVAPMPNEEKSKATGPKIILDGVRDPGNLGTIIRSMDWFGFNTLVCSEDCADFYNPKTLIATMGSFTRLRPYYTDLQSFLSEQKGQSVYGMVLGGTALEAQELTENAIYLLGSESHGIRKPLMPFVKNKVAITRFGGAESLNVAMATSILLHTIRTKTF